jgi:hypothetical protein
MNGSLFETRTDAEIRREAIAANDLRIHQVLMGGGPWELSERQRKLLDCLRARQGRLHAISISELTEKTGMDPRSIKSEVRNLVISFGLAIVSSRDCEDGGYYFATTAEERIAGTADYVKEIRALAERTRIIRNVHDMRTLLGQIANEIESAPAKELL